MLASWLVVGWLHGHKGRKELMTCFRSRMFSPFIGVPTGFRSIPKALCSMLLYFAKWANSSVSSFQIWTISLPRDSRFLIPQSVCKTSFVFSKSWHHIWKGNFIDCNGTKDAPIGVRYVSRVDIFHLHVPRGYFPWHIYPFEPLSSPKLTANIDSFSHMCSSQKFTTPVTARNGISDPEGFIAFEKVSKWQAKSAHYKLCLLLFSIYFLWK